MAMEEIAVFGMKNLTTLPSLANKCFNSLRDENDEPIYACIDPFLRNFVRQSIKGGRCTALNKFCKSAISDEVFNIISKELGVDGIMCESFVNYSDYTIKHRKFIEEEYDSQFDDYREKDEEERTKHNNKEVNKLRKHKKLQKLNLADVMRGFDATSLYPNAMLDEKYVYPKIETGFAFKPHTKKSYVDAFNIQTFNQDGNESAIIRIQYYNLLDLIFQHLPVKEKVKNTEVNCMRNAYIIDTLTSVEIQEIIKIVRKLIKN